MLIQQRYRLVKLIGQGGFGKTFLAVDEGQSPPYPCVIKQFWPQNQAPEVLNKATDLFQKEAVRLEELGKHPQIPALLANFEQDQQFYLVQEFIEGTNLAAVVKEEGAFNEAQIWQLLDDLLPVLKFIHDRKIIHRDIKPENIIRRFPPHTELESVVQTREGERGSRGEGEQRRELHKGQLVLVDFGAAKLVTAIDLLKNGTRIGSPEYVAPEQVRGKAVFASDLYSLGVTCIYLLTQIPPFDLFDVANDCWVWLQYLTNAVSDRLGKILDKLLQNAVNRRFQSADEVIKELECWNVGMLKVKSSNLRLEDSLPLRYQTFNPSNPPWQCLYTLTGHSGLFASVNSVAISPVSLSEAFPKEIAFSVDDQIREAEGDKAQALGTLRESAFSEEVGVGQILASGSDDKTVRLWNLNTGEALCTLWKHSGAVNSVAFSRDGKILATASDDKTITLWELTTGQIISEICTLTGHAHAVKSIAFSPDGQLLASGSWDKTVKLWDVNTREVLYTLKGHGLQVTSVAFSPDGQFLASASLDRTVRLWDLRSCFSPGLLPIKTDREPSLNHILSGHTGSVFSVAFSPDGKLLATGSDDRTIKLWNVDAGQATGSLRHHSWSVVAVAFTPDGETLVSGSWDKTVKLWKVSTGQEICTLSEHLDSVCAVTISFTGQVIASSSKDKTVKLWQRMG